MSETVWLIVTAAAIIGQVAVASRFRIQTRVLLWVQAFYWLLSYVFRPLYLWFNEPALGQVMYDYRFANVGYQQLLLAIAPIIAVGQLTFTLVLVLIVLLRRTISTRQTTPSPTTRANASRTFRAVALILVAGAWISRLVGYFGLALPVSFLSALGNFAPGAAVLLFPVRRRSDWRFLAVVVVLEGVWSVVGASKTPVLTVLTACLIRVGIEFGMKRLFTLLPLAIAVIAVAFAVVQPLKGVDTTQQAIAQNQTPLAALTSTVLQRTDILSPVADALLYPAIPWLSASQYWESFWTGAVPTGIHESVGVRWTDEVKTASFAQQYQDVYIASGVTAEGFVQGKYVGVVIENLALGILVVLLGRALASPIPAVAFAACVFAFDSSLYEGGFLWISECGSGALVVTVLSVIINLVSNTLNGLSTGRVRFTGENTPSTLPPIPTTARQP